MNEDTKQQQPSGQGQEAGPDFESIKQVNPYGAEYWLARDLQPLLGYEKSWQNFDKTIKRAITSFEQTGNPVQDQFNETVKLIEAGKGAQREVKDYALSRFACYLIAMNGEPSKPEIAAAQAYFAAATRAFEEISQVEKLREQQQQRLRLRQKVTSSNKDLAATARQAGVNSASFGRFQNAGYEGMYGGLDALAVKARKGIPERDDLLDRAGNAELAAHFFRITQTDQKLRVENIKGEEPAISAHRQVGSQVRQAIQEISGVMPEDLPAEPTIKPLMEERKRGRKKSLPAESGAGDQGSMFED